MRHDHPSGQATAVTEKRRAGLLAPTRKRVVEMVARMARFDALVAAGEALISKDETLRLLRLADRERTQSRQARAAFEQLAPREWDVLRALAEGMGDKEIAQRLDVRPGTGRAATWRSRS